ncbi:MAG: polysaccharide biosynthesis C-terminal domain-containing protein [Desulfocurvibacter africanus]
MSCIVEGLRVLIRLLKMVAFANILGPEARGVLSLVNLIPELIVTIGNMGFGQGVLYYVAKEKYPVRRAMGGTLLFLLIAGAFLAAAGYGVLHIDMLLKGQSGVIRQYGWAIVLAIPVFLAYKVGELFLTSLAQIRTINKTKLVESFLPLALFLLLIPVMGSPLDAAVWSWFVSLGLVCALIYFFLAKQGTFPPQRDWNFFRLGVRYGMASYFTQFFMLALNRMDYLFISAMLGAEDLGVYAISTSMAEILYILPASFAIPFIPILFGMDKEDAEHFTPMVIKLGLIIMSMAALCVYLLGRPVLQTFFSPGYLPAYEPLVLLLPGVISFSLFPFLRYDVFRRNRPGLVSGLTGMALLVNLALNYFWIPRYGISGAAMSSSISYTLSTCILLLIYCRLSGKRVHQVLFLSRSEAATILRYVRKRLLGR